MLIVGAGNSGAEIGVDIGRHPVLLAGRNVGYLPIEIRGWQGRLAFPTLWWVWENVLTERRRQRHLVQRVHTRLRLDRHPWSRHLRTAGK